MYLPKHSAETDLAKSHALMRDFPLAAIVTRGTNGLEANHIPLHLAPEAGPNGTQRGHEMLGGGVGIEIVVKRLVGKWKASR